MFQCIFPKFMEARSLLQSQKAYDLAFTPLEILLQKVEESSWNKEECGFFEPWDPPTGGGGRKCKSVEKI